MRILAPSILSADFYRLGEQLQILEQNDCTWLHIDVMDGAFVPNISFGMPVIESIRSKTKLFFDCHMMITKPSLYIEKMKACGADLMSVHVETEDPLANLKAIHAAGMKSGIVINPETGLDQLTDDMIANADMILLMTVHPGLGGQSYIMEVNDKIKALRTRLDSMGYKDLPIQVDGGINKNTIQIALDAGAEILVSGSSVFGGDMDANVKYFQKVLSEYDK